MSGFDDVETFSMSYDDLDAATEAASVRLPPGAAESDRVAHVRRLCEAMAELGYALNTYSHRVLVQSRRPRPDDELLAETVALRDALTSFGAEVRDLAETYRRIMRVGLGLERVDQ
jgi:sugar phosphate isomerase/epimerase